MGCCASFADQNRWYNFCPLGCQSRTCCFCSDLRAVGPASDQHVLTSVFPTSRYKYVIIRGSLLNASIHRDRRGGIRFLYWPNYSHFNSVKWHWFFPFFYAFCIEMEAWWVRLLCTASCNLCEPTWLTLCYIHRAYCHNLYNNQQMHYCICWVLWRLLD
jgi:hypothetical protein